jgi:hypothetical protein
MSEAREYEFGETTDLCAEWTERDDAAFTISSATVTVADDAGTHIVNGAAATVDNVSDPPRCFYLETFDAAGGYVSGESYLVTFSAVMSTGHTKRHTYTITLKAVA